MNETLNPQETAQPQPVTNQAPPPPQNTQTQEPPTSITEEKKKPTLPIILSILLVLALGAAGYFAYMYYQPNIPFITSTETITESTPPQTPAPTSDPTANWNLVENTIDQFSFKCPPEWKYNDNKSYDGSVSVKECIINYQEGGMSFDDGISVGFKYVPKTISNNKTRDGDDAKLADIYALSVISQENSQPYSQNNFQGWISNKTQSLPLRIIARKYMNSGYFEFDVIAVGNTNTNEWYENISNQILSTFKYAGSEEESLAYLQSLIPSTWKRHTFPSKNITIYAPPTYKSNLEEYDSSSLIRFWQGENQDTATIQLNIKQDWTNTGNAKDLPKNFITAGSIPTARKNSPKIDETKLDRYISNYFFEYNSKVYSTTCAHNWIEKEYQTCNLMMQTMSFN